MLPSSFPGSPVLLSVGVMNGRYRANVIWTLHQKGELKRERDGGKGKREGGGWNRRDRGEGGQRGGKGRGMGESSLCRELGSAGNQCGCLSQHGHPVVQGACLSVWLTGYDSLSACLSLWLVMSDSGCGSLSFSLLLPVSLSVYLKYNTNICRHIHILYMQIQMCVFLFFSLKLTCIGKCLSACLPVSVCLSLYDSQPTLQCWCDVVDAHQMRLKIEPVHTHSMCVWMYELIELMLFIQTDVEHSGDFNPWLLDQQSHFILRFYLCPWCWSALRLDLMCVWDGCVEVVSVMEGGCHCEARSQDWA